MLWLAPADWAGWEQRYLSPFLQACGAYSGRNRRHCFATHMLEYVAELCSAWTPERLREAVCGISASCSPARDRRKRALFSRRTIQTLAILDLRPRYNRRC